MGRRSLMGVGRRRSGGGGTNNITVRSSATEQPAGPTDFAITLPSAHAGDVMFLAVESNTIHAATVADTNGTLRTVHLHLPCA